MRILILNPNMTCAMTVRMAEVAHQVAAPGTELLTATATRGFPYISSRSEAQVAGVIALEMIAEHIGSIDAVVIAAYGDPGLKAARELFDIPVVGMAEAAMLSACMLGARFSVVTFAETLVPWYLESIRAAGLHDRFASIRVPGAEFQSVLDVRDELREHLIAEAAGAADDGADVVILGGAPLAGLAREVDDAPTVLIDPISAAVKQAEALVTLAPSGASAASFKRPPGKENAGLDDRLARWMRRQ